jgi:bifunctional non-homologous end joining protein LigD
MAPRRKFPAGFVEPCIPTLAARPPPGADWVHEINHDGYRLIICRDGYAVCLFTRLGYDWSDRYPATTASPSSVNDFSRSLPAAPAIAGTTGRLWWLRGWVKETFRR